MSITSTYSLTLADGSWVSVSPPKMPMQSKCLHSPKRSVSVRAVSPSIERLYSSLKCTQRNRNSMTSMTSVGKIGPHWKIISWSPHIENCYMSLDAKMHYESHLVNVFLEDLLGAGFALTVKLEESEDYSENPSWKLFIKSSEVRI